MHGYKWPINCTRTRTLAGERSRYLMSTVNAILMGEIVGGQRGRISADIGYEMWGEWREFTAGTGGLHEFTSPTYTCAPPAANNTIVSEEDSGAI